MKRYVNPWWQIPSVLDLSDAQRGDVAYAQRLRRYLYSPSNVTPEQQDSARRVLARHDANDLADMLGLTS